MSIKSMKIINKLKLVFNNKSVLIFGLGNPGKEYYASRHSIGRRAVDYLAEKENLEFKNMPKLKVDLGKIDISGKKVFLAKSETFMNESGYALRLIKDYYKIRSENIWIIQDDVDIPFGKIKVSSERGAAGHHGVESVIRYLGANNFNRIRIGIWNRPFSEKNKNVTEKYVMDKFLAEEENELGKIIKKAAELLLVAISR